MSEPQLERLYRQYGYAVHRRCLQHLRDPVEADDALQEVFLRVHRYGGTLRGAPLPWLHRIADRYCLDRLTRRRPDRPGDGEAQTELSELPCPMPSAESGRGAEQLLAACPPRVQRAAWLYHVDRLTQDEVARELDCSRKTVKVWLARFRETAGRMLGMETREVKL